VRDQASLAFLAGPGPFETNVAPRIRDIAIVLLCAQSLRRSRSCSARDVGAAITIVATGLLLRSYMAAAKPETPLVYSSCVSATPVERMRAIS